jgi:pimeloyl-ACP methyl ester carboxylesterase
MLLFRILVLGLIALPAHVQPATAPSSAAPANAKASPVVLVHGGWGGGWALKPIENHLRATGYTVYRPSLFGTGETAHLASPQIGLDTHIQQIVNLIEYEDLEDVVLIGYSYSGMVVTGVVDRIPQRIRRVIYIDAFLPENGESALSFVPGMHSAFAQQLAFAIKASELFGLVPAFWESPGDAATPGPAAAQDTDRPDRAAEPCGARRAGRLPAVRARRPAAGASGFRRVSGKGRCAPVACRRHDGRAQQTEHQSGAGRPADTGLHRRTMRLLQVRRQQQSTELNVAADTPWESAALRDLNQRFRHR